MPTLVLRNLPDELHGKLKAAAAAHHRSMNQEAIHALSVVLAVPIAAEKPATEQSLAWLARDVWPALNADHRAADEILGYDADGMPG
jgi:antitoxin VapB